MATGDDDITVHPPASPEHIYPVVAMGTVPLADDVVDKLVDFARRHEMAELFWIASEKRPDIPVCTLHADSVEEVAALVGNRDALEAAVTFLQTFYKTLEYYYAGYDVPAPTADAEVYIPCRVPRADGQLKMYNIISLVPGRDGLVRAYPADHPRFRYYCSWCLNRHADKRKRLLKCGRCCATRYCGIGCQRKDWGAGHKAVCKVVEQSEEASNEQP